jgi:hypothetical protein
MAHETFAPCLNLHNPFLSSKYLANGILSTFIVGLLIVHLEHSCPFSRSHEQDNTFASFGSSGGIHLGQNTVSGWVHNQTGSSVTRRRGRQEQQREIQHR